MNISIITNTYNRDLHLVERSLNHSLYHQDKLKNVILIDQNTIPLNLDSKIINNPKFELCRSTHKCVAAARNLAPISDDLDWLIFCDDDGYIANDYLVKMEEIISKFPELEIIAGSIIRDDNNEFYTPRHKAGGSLKNFRHTKLLMGSNFAVKASTFKKLRGFDINFGAGGYWGSGEETDFCWKAYFSNTQMEYFPELKVFHIKPYAFGLKHSSIKAFKYGLGKGALVTKWLIFEKKPIVLFELFEMTLIPIIQILKSVITLRPQNSLIYLSAIAGRYYGFFKALLRKDRMQL